MRLAAIELTNGMKGFVNAEKVCFMHEGTEVNSVRLYTAAGSVEVKGSILGISNLLKISGTAEEFFNNAKAGGGELGPIGTSVGLPPDTKGTGTSEKK